MKKLFPLLVILIGTHLHAQFTLKGQVIDSATKNPVPFSLVLTNSGKTGVISDAKGKFELNLPDSLNNNILSVINIGFDTTTISIRDFQKSTSGVIYLNHKIFVMPEVNISSKETGLCKAAWGATRKSLFFGGGFFFDAGCEVAVYVSNPKADSGIISILRFYVENKGYPDTPFRAKLYFVNPKDKSPGSLMIDQDFILHGEEGDEWITIDISAYNISIPKEGFFVSMEWLPASQSKPYTETIHKTEFKGNGQVLGVNKEIKSNITWTKTFLSSWFLLDDPLVSNAMIGADVLKKCK
jgi:hypothetical protein